MKNICRISGIILLIISVFSCNKKDKPASLPVVSTSAVKEILYITAISGGSVIEDGGAAATRGVCWGTSSNPTIENSRTIDGTGTGEFTSSITVLSIGTSYYLRAYATNSAGTVYGSEVLFTTHVTGVKFNPDLTYGIMNDIESNSYKTITIGTQEWMAENLKTRKFNDGEAIPLITGNAEWSNLLTPAYSWFDNNDTLYANFYGAHYNWFAVNTGKLCPAGWHVPSDSEWQILVDYLGGNNIAGSKIKEAGTNNWATTNKLASNESGFTALPAGLRGTYDGIFGGQGLMGGWWSTTELESSPLGTARVRWIHADTSVVARDEIFKKDGFSIRCVKY